MARAKYRARYYTLSANGLKKMQYVIIALEKSLISDGLKGYLQDKCIEELYKICKSSLAELRLDEPNSDLITNAYMSSFGTEIKGDYIYIYNDAVIDMAQKVDSHSKINLANYPLKLSLTKIVEYGIGFMGEITDPEGVDPSWEYDVNAHGNKGWWYRDNGGNLQWTSGYEGKLIFYKLKKAIKEKAPEWVKEYVENAMDEVK